MIERRHPASKWIWVFVCQRAGNTETEVLCDLRHRRHKQQRLVYRDLCGLANRMFGTPLIDVIYSEHVRDKETAKLSWFEELRQIGPVFEIGVLKRTIARMRPKPRGLVSHAIHVEGI